MLNQDYKEMLLILLKNEVAVKDCFTSFAMTSLLDVYINGKGKGTSLMEKRSHFEPFEF